MEQLKECPICGQKENKLHLICKDYTVSKGNFNLEKCDSCGFIYTNPRPSEGEMGKYYQSENYISHTDTQKGLINQLYQIARKYTLKSKLKLIDSLSQRGKILDIGCGTGNFIETCNQNGWDAYGIEPDNGARTKANELNPNKVFEETKLNELEANSFNIITMWHVLEHVYHLKERIEQLKKVLHTDGKLIVAVPNCSSFDAQYYGNYWGAYDVPRHLYHFKPQDIETLFDTNGMEVIKILPMKLDSFYVSMLSEKYKGGNIVNGIVTGLRSNMKANNVKNNWSSQIYIISHKKR